jgi:hypothetical protein
MTGQRAGFNGDLGAKKFSINPGRAGRANPVSKPADCL